MKKIQMIDLYHLNNPETIKRVPMPADNFTSWGYAKICHWCQTNHPGWRLEV